MSLKFKAKETVFPQSNVKRNFPKNYSQLKKSFRSYEDSATFFMLADATCSTRPTVDIKKIHVNVFSNLKITTPKLSKNTIETLEIMSDDDLLKELKRSKAEARKGEVISWKKAKISV